MLNRLTMAIGAISSAAGLGLATFSIGHGIAAAASLADAKNIAIGLLAPIAAGVRGIFALQLRPRP